MAEYEVTGIRWQMGDGLTMEQRTQKAEEFIRPLKVGTPLILAAEPDNPKDCEAIAVYMDYTRRVGYIKHESCKEVKPLLDSDGQCDAVVSGNDGHVTFFVEIPNAPEVIVSPVETTRRLPECPLPQGIGLAFSDEERALQVVAPRLVKQEVSADTAGNLLKLSELYIPLSRLSFCREDNFWRDHVLKLLRKACKLELPQDEKERLEQLYQQLRETEGDFHFTDEHLQQQLFDQQLDVLRKQAEGKDGLFAKYEKYIESQPDIIGSLVKWFGNMPHAELCNYKEHGCLAQRLNYIGVSRQELYEVYAVILLLDKYGRGRIYLPKELDTERAKIYFAKAIEKGYMEAIDGGKYRWLGTGKKPNNSELAYFLGKVYKYKYSISGNTGENFPEESLNQLFGVTRLYSSLTQVYNAKKIQRWRPLIDKLFEED
ncbi:MAG: HIRAN domain-containing protein [Prevotella sp.]|nr:HIRAN domain-containing protein [Prevotella sp.]